jgi:DNA-binding transcriptional MerR regulator
VSDPERYSIGELAERAGVSRRTVRYYVQRGLLPAPLGRGRGEHYGAEHLAAVLRVKARQEQGESLEEIRRRQAGEPEPVVPPAAPAPTRCPQPARAPRGQVWVRQVVVPGVELHVQGTERALDERELAALAQYILALREEGGDG